MRKQLEAERGETLKASSQKSFADPDANMMMTGEGSLQYCYNAQVAASEDGVIVATGVTTSPLDVQQLVPMVEEIQATTRRKPGVVVADAGYLSEKNLKQLRQKRQRCLVAVRGKKAPKWPRGRQTQRMHRLLRLPWAKKIYNAPQDPRRASLRGDQADDALPALRHCEDVRISGASGTWCVLQRTPSPS